MRVSTCKDFNLYINQIFKGAFQLYIQKLIDDPFEALIGQENQDSWEEDEMLEILDYEDCLENFIKKQRDQQMINQYDNLELVLQPTFSPPNRSTAKIFHDLDFVFKPK